MPAAARSRARTRHFHPPRAVWNLQHRLRRRASCAKENRQADHPLVADQSHLDAWSFASGCEERDHAALGEVDMRDGRACLEQHGAVRENHRLEIGEQRAVGGSREREEESIALRWTSDWGRGHRQPVAVRRQSPP